VIRNRYSASCSVCPEVVSPYAGLFEGADERGAPRVVHLRCRSTAGGSQVLVDALAAEGKELMPHQIDGIAWLRARLSQGALLSDEQGLGKTMQAIAALPPGARVVVVCPAIAKPVWGSHFATYRPDFMSGELYGRSTWHAPQHGEAVILNYEILPRWLERVESGSRTIPSLALDLCREWGDPALINESSPLIVIGDEIHYTKNRQAKRSRRMTGLCRLAVASGGAAWGLSGTPLKNRPPDLYDVLRTLQLTAETWPKFTDFVEDFGGSKGNWGYTWDAPVSRTVPAILNRVMLGREKDLVLDLPPKVHEFYPVVLDSATTAAADRAARALRECGVDLEGATLDALRTMTRGAAFNEMSRACAMLAAAKVPTLLSLLDEHESSGGRPPLAWSRHVAPVAAAGNRSGWATLVGGTSKPLRRQAEADFQARRLKGLALTTGAAATAITLTAARRAIFVDTPWTPTDLEQAEDRCHRIGTTHSVIYTRLLAGHALDRRLWELMGDKRSTVDDSVRAARRLNRADETENTQ